MGDFRNKHLRIRFSNTFKQFSRQRIVSQLYFPDKLSIFNPRGIEIGFSIERIFEVDPFSTAI